jgi:thiamine-phosphate pyrophosphorylase
MAGVDLIQIRERDLPAGELYTVVETAVLETGSLATRILVNDRLDVAVAAEAAGVHLPAHGLPIAEVRGAYPNLLIGASTHNLEELRAAEVQGADFAVFGPVFETPSKLAYGGPLGIEKLGEAVRAVRIPVLALGGITFANAGTCLGAGAAGLAAITLFQSAEDLPGLVAKLSALAFSPPTGQARFRTNTEKNG